MLKDPGHEDAVSLEAQGYWRSIPTAHPKKDLFYPDKLSPEEQVLAAALADQTSGESIGAAEEVSHSSAVRFCTETPL